MEDGKADPCKMGALRGCPGPHFSKTGAFGLMGFFGWPGPCCSISETVEGPACTLGG